MKLDQDYQKVWIALNAIIFVYGIIIIIIINCCNIKEKSVINIIIYFFIEK